MSWVSVSTVVIRRMIRTACISHSVATFGCGSAEEAHLMIGLHSSVFHGGGKVRVQDMCHSSSIPELNVYKRKFKFIQLMKIYGSRCFVSCSMILLWSAPITATLVIATQQ